MFLQVKVGIVAKSISYRSNCVRLFFKSGIRSTGLRLLSLTVVRAGCHMLFPLFPTAVASPHCKSAVLQSQSTTWPYKLCSLTTSYNLRLSTKGCLLFFNPSKGCAWCEYCHSGGSFFGQGYFFSISS